MAHPTTNRVGAVCFDAMYTVLEPVFSRAALEATIFKCVTKRTVDAEELMLLITTLKRQRPRSGKDMGSYWPPLNRLLLAHYGVTGDLDAMARQIHEEHYVDSSLYTVRPDMRELLEWVSQETVTIAVASNQRQKQLLELLRHHDVLRYFENGGRGNRVFTSERIGSAKPSRRFLQRVARHLRIESIREILLIGNSLENDAQAAKLGVRTAILDRSGRLGEVTITLPGVTPVDSPAAIQAWIQHMRAPALTGGNGNLLRAAAEAIPTPAEGIEVVDEDQATDGEEESPRTANDPPTIS